jgi:hypothetical protein
MYSYVETCSFGYRFRGTNKFGFFFGPFGGGGYNSVSTNLLMFTGWEL